MFGNRREMKAVFAVLFEVHPKREQRDAYLGYAKLLRRGAPQYYAEVGG